MHVIEYERYLDKVLGCWFGKILGGSGGVAYEGVKERIRSVDFTQIINPQVPNDDFDLQVMWLKALEDKGPYLTSEYMAELWEKACKYPWSEYGYFLKNHKRGIRAPYSGWFNNEFFKNGMGCPIRSEIWAVAYPGMPNMAGKTAALDASLDHAEEALWGECFLARLESILFIKDDVIAAIEEALEGIDSKSRTYACIRELILNREAGVEFDDVLDGILKNYSHPDFTNSTQNIGIALAGVLYGESDMERTINITLSGGYDTDCTCATAGAIAGILLGWNAIPGKLKDLIKDEYVTGVDIWRSDNKITTFAEDSARVGVSIVRHLGENLLQITNLPSGVHPLRWEKPERIVDISVEYCQMPAIGVDDFCDIRVAVENRGGIAITGCLEIRRLKPDWSVSYDDKIYSIPAGAKLLMDVRVRTDHPLYLDQTNILEAVFVRKDLKDLEEQSVRFGIAGAIPYRVYGPFFHAPRWTEDPNWPSCHNNDDLPSILSMVHNEVFLDREYLDEDQIMKTPQTAFRSLIGTICAKEDVIPLEENIAIKGECGFLLLFDVVFKEDTKAWIVIGNTDAFKLTLNGELCIRKDEHMLWTPINNAVIGHFKKGVNRIFIKLLRRSDCVKFSLGIKRNDGKHYHQAFWMDDLTYQVIQ